MVDAPCVRASDFFRLFVLFSAQPVPSTHVVFWFVVCVLVRPFFCDRCCEQACPVVTCEQASVWASVHSYMLALCWHALAQGCMRIPRAPTHTHVSLCRFFLRDLRLYLVHTKIKSLIEIGMMWQITEAKPNRDRGCRWTPLKKILVITPISRPYMHPSRPNIVHPQP
jgi:hypothetical protein